MPDNIPQSLNVQDISLLGKDIMQCRENSYFEALGQRGLCMKLII